MKAVRRKLKNRTLRAGPSLPAAGAFLWAVYCELDDARNVGMAFSPISEADLYFYAANRNFRWLPNELGAMRALDRAHRIFVAEQQKQANAKGARP